MDLDQEEWKGDDQKKKKNPQYIKARESLSCPGGSKEVCEAFGSWNLVGIIIYFKMCWKKKKKKTEKKN